MEIEEVFENEEMRDTVALMVQEFEDVFERIRAMAHSDLSAWFAAQAWFRWQEKERKRANTRRKTDCPASEVQVCLLNTLGVETVADLTRAEAQSLIETVRKERPEKKEKEWY